MQFRSGRMRDRLVPRTRSSRISRREFDRELRVQRGTRIIELLVVLDSEVRKPGCRTNDANFGIGPLVPRTRSSRMSCRAFDRELRVQRGTRIIELLVVLDSEVRKRGCGTNDANFGIGPLEHVLAE